MSTLTELKARVDAATGPDQFLDLDISEALCGLKLIRHADNRVTAYGDLVDPRLALMPFTSSIDAAVSLTERVLPGWVWLIRNDENRGFFANLHRANESPNLGYPGWPNYASKPALAILSALLAALIAKEQADAQG